jgi:hypothetical protein
MKRKKAEEEVKRKKKALKPPKKPVAVVILKAMRHMRQAVALLAMARHGIETERLADRHPFVDTAHAPADGVGVSSTSAGADNTTDGPPFDPDPTQSAA